jgi:predicted nucleotidyltransferase
MKRSAVREAVGRFRAANPRVFGSVLHGTDRDGSDLDLLVDALPGATLLDLGDLEEELKSLLGVDVDLLTPATCRRSSGQGARGGATDMSENRLPDYLDHIQQAATDARSFVEGMTSWPTSAPSRPSS